MNGVTGSVLQVLKHLHARGHETLVIAPDAEGAERASDADRTELLRSVPLPSYPQVRVVFARAARIQAILRDFDPDVVHLASPFVLGWQALAAADALDVPTVAIYQTDVVAYTERYGVPSATALAAAHVTRLHRRATLTLAPSTASLKQLRTLGVDRVRLWRRGVDAERFAPEHRSGAWRSRIAPGQTIIGYVGRLAPEKQVADLATLCSVPGAKLVIVGDGPERAELERAMPDAAFLGHLSGDELATAVASFDVFVHPGESETFGQTLQEALASGVPVVATGRGGPVDIVRNSVDGWLYRPGDLGDLRARVEDLVGDAAKRRAFAEAARAGMRERTWDAVCRELTAHYDDAMRLHAVDRSVVVRGPIRPSLTPATPAAPRLQRYVALGDSLTEGLCDTSRVPAGQFRGWADRLALLLASTTPGTMPFEYANLAVRSRRVRDLGAVQVPRALELRPDLVSILMGHNDLVGHGADPVGLARELEVQVRRLRDAGCEVLLVTPFLPRRAAARLFAKRFARYASELRRIAADTGCVLLDLDLHPAIGDASMWADDKVHLRSGGHRFVSYRAAEVLGVPQAEQFGALDAALHAAEDPVPVGNWVARDALPWVWRRLRGQTAGDGRVAKHDDYIEIPRGGTRAVVPR